MTSSHTQHIQHTLRLEYIPFQTLTKAKAYQILNYGRPYNKYTRFRISENPEQITDVYVDDEPCIMFAADDESQITHQVEIHYSAESKQKMKSRILTNSEIDILVAKYGCIL